MDNITAEVARQYIDQYCGIYYRTSKTKAEMAVASTCLATLGQNNGIILSDFVIQHTSTVWFVAINGSVTVGPSPSDLLSRLEYWGITLPEDYILSCECELWLIDRLLLDYRIATDLNEMSNQVNYTSADDMPESTSWPL